MHTIRTVSAALLAVPIAVGAAAPALSAPPERYTTSGAHLEATGLVVGTLNGIDGNVHLVELDVDRTDDGTLGYASVESFSCPDGVTQPYDPQTGEELCDFAGYGAFLSHDAEVVVGKKLESASLTGTFSSLFMDSSLDVDVDLAATSERPATIRSRDILRDPATGYSYVGTTTQTLRWARAAGTVGGVQLAEGSGVISSFTFRAVERV